MSSTDSSLNKIMARVRQVHLGDHHVREDTASSINSTGRSGERLTPAPKSQGDPSMDLQPPSDEGKDMKDHIIWNIGSKFGKKLLTSYSIVPSMKWFDICSWTIACGPSYYLDEEDKRCTSVKMSHQIPKTQTIIEEAIWNMFMNDCMWAALLPRRRR